MNKMLKLLFLTLFVAAAFPASNPNNPKPCDVNCKVTPEHAKVCKSETKMVFYTIQNTGGERATFTVDCSLENGGEVKGFITNADTSFTLEPGEARRGNPIVHINTDSGRGTIDLVIKVTAPCFSGLTEVLKITVPPPSISITIDGKQMLCENERATAIATIENTGDCKETVEGTVEYNGPGLIPSVIKVQGTIGPRKKKRFLVPLNAVTLPGNPGEKVDAKTVVTAKAKVIDTGLEVSTQLTVTTTECDMDDPIDENPNQAYIIGFDDCYRVAFDDQGNPIPGYNWLYENFNDIEEWTYQQDFRIVLNKEFGGLVKGIVRRAKIKFDVVSGDPTIADLTFDSGLLGEASTPIEFGRQYDIELAGYSDHEVYTNFFINTTANHQGKLKIKPTLEVAAVPDEEDSTQYIDTEYNIIDIEVFSFTHEIDVAPETALDVGEIYASYHLFPVFEPNNIQALNNKTVTFKIHTSWDGTYGDDYATLTATMKDGVATILYELPEEIRILANDITVTAEFDFSDPDVRRYFYLWDRKRAASTTIIQGNSNEIEIAIKELEQIRDGATISNVEVIVKDKLGNRMDVSTASWMLSSGFNNLAPDGQNGVGQFVYNGRVSADILAPSVNRNGVLKVMSESAEAEVMLKTLPVTGTFLPQPPVIIDEPHTVTVTLETNAANGTPVLWVDGLPYKDSQSVYENFVFNGKATYNFSVDASTQLGTHVLMATIGTKTFHMTVEHVSEKSFQAKFGDKYIVGNANIDGTFEFNANQYTPVAGVPVVNLPVDTRSVSYKAGTEIELTGAPGSVATVELHDPDNAQFLSLTGLDANNSIQLDAFGQGIVNVNSTGVWQPDPNSYLSKTVEFRIRSLQAANEFTPTLILVERDMLCYTFDAVQSFLGGDPETTVGVAFNLAGGLMIIGDVGSLAKNGWRMAGFSDEEPNYIEITLSGLGLISELAVGIGEAADIPITSLRAIFLYAKNTPFGDLMLILAKRSYQNPRDLLKLGSFLKTMIGSERVLDGYKAMLNSDQLLNNAITMSSRFDSVGDEVAEAIIKSGEDAVSGINGAQRAINVLSQMPDKVVNSLAVSGKLTDAILGMSKALANIDETLMLRILNNDLYNDAYNYAHLLIDMGKIADAPGFARLAVTLANRGSGRFGFLYELQVAAYMKALRPNDTSFFVSKFVRATEQFTSTDIDIGFGTIFMQVKRSIAAFRAGVSDAKAIAKAQVWISKVVNAGATEVYYICPKASDIPQKMLNFLNSGTHPVKVTIMHVPALGKAAVGS